MAADSSSHLSTRPPEHVAPDLDAAQERRDGLQLRLQRALELRLAPEQLAALVEIHRAVAGHLDRKSLFTAIAQALQGVVPVSRSLLLLPSNDPTALTVYASHGRLGVEFYQGQTIARTGSIPGWVVEHGRPFVLDRAEHIRERFPVSYQRLRQWGMESVAVVPLLTEGRCVGALSLMSEQADAWSGVSSVLLEEIAASMAAALEHCMAYEEVGRLRDEQTALLEINRAVARHLHRDELFATLAECLRDLLPSDRFGIELPVDNGHLRAHVLPSRNANTAPVQIEELPSARTARRAPQNRSGCAGQYQRAHPRRDRNRQGADRPCPPQPQPPPRPSAGEGELQRHLRGPCRERVVRACEGCLHRCPRAPRRSLRVRRWRHDLPR